MKATAEAQGKEFENGKIALGNEIYGNNQVSQAEAAKIGERKISKSGYERMDRLKPYFEEASKKYGIPVSKLEAIAAQESMFDNSQVSSAGARGIMQVIPKYAGNYNLKDERENILAGAKIYSEMRGRYGSMGEDEVLRGYNGGSHRGSKENRMYAPGVNNYEQQILSQQYKDPAIGEAMQRDAAARNGGGVHGTLDVVHRNEQGAITKREDVPLKPFRQENSWHEASRRRVFPGYTSW